MRIIAMAPISPSTNTHRSNNKRLAGHTVAQQTWPTCNSSTRSYNWIAATWTTTHRLPPSRDPSCCVRCSSFPMTTRSGKCVKRWPGKSIFFKTVVIKISGLLSMFYVQPAKKPQEAVFVKSASNMQCYVVKNTLLQTTFSVFRLKKLSVPCVFCNEVGVTCMLTSSSNPLNSP